MAVKDPETVFQEYKKEVESELDAYFRWKLSNNTDDLYLKIVGMIRDYTMRGGKRIRPILINLGHDLISDHDSRVVKASISIELSQSYFLIQDDIMDQSDIRRGKPSFHMEVLENIFHGDSTMRRLAENIGIVASDMAESFSHEAIFLSGLSSDLAVIADRELTSIFESTGYGQIVDIFSSFIENFGASDLIKLHLLKTARYTIEGPLCMGAMIADPQCNLSSLRNYGNLLGVAFQVYDDILGMFGDEKTLGKSVKSDVNEGKKTLLILKAMENSSDADKTFIKRCISSGNVSDSDFRRLQDIVRDSGSLKYSQDLVSKFNKRAKQYLEDVKGREDIKKVLAWMGDYIISRTY